MRVGKIFKIIGKNALVFFAGAAAAVAVVIFLILPSALEKAGDKAGLGIIALAPVFLILYGALGIIIGGFGSVIVYNIIKLIKRDANKGKSFSEFK